jgi:hypothetical protein
MTTPNRELLDLAKTLSDMRGRFERLPERAKHEPRAAEGYITVLNQYLSNLNKLQGQIDGGKVKVTKADAEAIAKLYGMIESLSSKLAEWRTQAEQYQAEAKEQQTRAAELKKAGGAGATEKTRGDAESKRKAELELREARNALDSAIESWERRKKRAEAEVESLEKKKPATGLYAQQNPDESEEVIKATLANKEKQVLDLETQIEDAQTWGPEKILSWYRKTETEKQHTAEEQERAEKRRAAKLEDPRLKKALTEMASELKFPVQNVSGPLLDAELSEILLAQRPEHQGESAALDRFIPATGVVLSWSDAVERVEQAAFPDGPVKEVIIQLIGETAETGAGVGARLRVTIPKTVVNANAAGFNITNRAVQNFLSQVYKAIVAEIPSDSGSTPGDRHYTGELKSKDLPDDV